MMPPQHIFIGGHIVHPVIDFMGGGLEMGIKFEDFLRNKARINEITGSHTGEADNKQQYRAHVVSPSGVLLLSMCRAF